MTFLDINASVEARGTLLHMVERVADTIFIPFTVGGGVRSADDFRDLLRAGADKASINTAAVTNPQIVTECAQKFGSQCVVVAIDAKREANGKYQVYTHGGRRATERDAIEWAQEIAELGAGEILLTSIDRDGTHNGFELELTRTIAAAVNIPVIASGGAGKLEDFYDALAEGNADAVLAASLFHDRVMSIGQVKEYLAGRGTDEGLRGDLNSLSWRCAKRLLMLGLPSPPAPSPTGENFFGENWLKVRANFHGGKSGQF